MKNKIILVLGLAILIAVLASFFASSNPDGLEWVAEKLGFIEKGQGFESLMTDYAMPGINNPVLTAISAGIIGLLVCFSIFWGSAKIISKPSA